MLKFDNPSVEALRKELLGDQISSQDGLVPAIACQMSHEHIELYESHIRKAEVALKLAKATLALARLANLLDSTIVEAPG